MILQLEVSEIFLPHFLILGKLGAQGGDNFLKNTYEWSQKNH